MQQNTQQNVFLATTALEDFWDTTGPVVFLGLWCRTPARSHAWQSLDATVMPGAFEGAGAVHAAYKRVDAAYERALPSVAAALNALHGTQHSVRYWRIVAGPWLQMYMAVIYDRWRHLQLAMAAYPGFSTIGLAPEAFIVPNDTHDFACHVLEDTFNLQIFTRILATLSVAMPTRGASTAQRASYVERLAPTGKQRAVRCVTQACARGAAALRRTVLLKDSYFPKKVEVSLVLGTAGKVLPIWGPADPLAYPPLDTGLRARHLSGLDLGDGDFERCVAALLGADLPVCFIEGYQTVREASARTYPKRVHAIFSANAWYYDEVFKHWAAVAADQGSSLYGIQHGGNYGALAMMPSEDHETSIVGEYYTWGWERDNRAARVVPMPASKLSGLQGVAGGGAGALWVATSLPRYLVQFPWVPGDFERYLQWQGRFAAVLSGAVRGQLRLRPHREDNGWDLVGRLREVVPALAIETWDVTFRDSLNNCALYICDHLSTTFIEALVLKVPTILFWDPQQNLLRPEARDCYDLLRANGILFDSPEAAAQAVNLIIGDVEGWWNQPERQRAVAAFCARFARTSADAPSLWQARFEGMSARATPQAAG